LERIGVLGRGNLQPWFCFQGDDGPNRVTCRVGDFPSRSHSRFD
jgi:hypothetical protein